MTSVGTCNFDSVSIYLVASVPTTEIVIPPKQEGGNLGAGDFTNLKILEHSLQWNCDGDKIPKDIPRRLSSFAAWFFISTCYCGQGQNKIVHMKHMLYVFSSSPEIAWSFQLTLQMSGDVTNQFAWVPGHD